MLNFLYVIIYYVMWSKAMPDLLKSFVCAFMKNFISSLLSLSNNILFIHTSPHIFPVEI